MLRKASFLQPVSFKITEMLIWPCDMNLVTRKQISRICTLYFYIFQFSTIILLMLFKIIRESIFVPILTYVFTGVE